MPRLRVLLLWLLMLALPLQGMAAAAMVACGLPQPLSTSAAHHAQPPHAEGHEHAAMHAHHAAPAGGHQAHAADQHHDEHAKADSGIHKCSVCSACHAAALLNMHLPAQAHALPQASPSMGSVAMASQAPRLPDKPPRA